MVIAERETKLEEAVDTQTTVILCAWRGLLAETAECMLMLQAMGWKWSIKRGDALISRSRSVAVSSWYRNTTDDVFLMIDDDVVFLPEHAERVVAIAREKRTIVCAAYPVKDGGHLACRRAPGQEIIFGEDSPPIEITYPATGFMACHRDVITAMIEARNADGSAVFPLCGAASETPMWPMFDCFTVTGENGDSEYLSEDYAFGEQAKRLGFTTWLDPSVILYHMGYYPYTIENMKNVRNFCGDCGANLDAQGNGHRDDCNTAFEPEQLKTSRGHFLKFDPRDSVITPAIRQTGQWEEYVAEAIEKHLKPGWTFLDLGAHVGYFSVIAAARGADVIAVEANPAYEGLLRENMARNGLVAETHKVGVSDSTGTAYLRADPRFASHPSAAGLYENGPGKTVPIAHLEDILQFRRPEFIKADIEGLEYAVFADSPDVLEEARVIIFEVGPAMCERYGRTMSELIYLVRSHGFYITQIDGSPIPSDFFEMGQDHYANLLAVKP